MHIHVGSSLELKSLKPFSFRLFSIDGGHSRVLTVNDLTLAAHHLVSGGILILDDVFDVFRIWAMALLAHADAPPGDYS